MSVREEGNLPASVPDKKLIPHINTAMLELRKLVTTEVYETVLGNSKSVDADELLQYEIFKKSESNLTLSFAVYSLNLETQGEGFVKIKGWDSSRSEVLSQNDIDKLSAHFRAVAVNLIEDYLPGYEDDEDTDEDESDDIFFSGNSVVTVI